MCQCLTVLLTLLITGSGISLLLGLFLPRIVDEGNEEVLELIIGKHTVGKEEMEEAERQFKQLARIMALITAHLSIVAYLMICVAKIPFPLPLPC
jgi:hypothetical protein